jgi:hypothetical protein
MARVALKTFYKKVLSKILLPVMTRTAPKSSSSAEIKKDDSASPHRFFNQFP